MRIGIVGCGIVSRFHLAAASSYPGTEIVGIADCDGARAQAQAARFAGARSFDRLSDLLSLRPDVVHVVTPPDTHEALVLEALAAGAHVYVEKPMAISVAACDNMARAATRAQRQLCVGQSMLFTPAMMQAKALLASGKVGEIVQAEAAFNYDVRRNQTYGPGHWAKNLPGGLAEDLAVHPASVLVALLGRAQRVLAVSRTAPEIPDRKTADVRAVVEADRGLGTLAVSLRARPDVRLVDICCTQGMLRLNISSMSMTVYRELPVPKKIARPLGNLDVAMQLIGGTVSAAWQLARGKVDGSYGIVPLIHAFYSALQAGNPAPVGPAEGAMAVRMMRAIWPEYEMATRAAAAQ
jgi:predicted dehydrogenase